MKQKHRKEFYRMKKITGTVVGHRISEGNVLAMVKWDYCKDISFAWWAYEKDIGNDYQI